MAHLDDLLTTMADAAHQAGRVMMKYHRPGETIATRDQLKDKGFDNPLTKADLEADRLLHKILLNAHPDYGWLSEETTDDPARLDKKRAWVVDPIDGTKEFIMGIPQFAVSIGLVEDGEPLAACVFNPAADELFTAARGQGVWLNGSAIRTTDREQLNGASVLASRSETRRGEWDPFKDELEITTMGSIAYKFAVLAAGRVDLTFTLTPKNEWDYCAGTLLITEAGGQVTLKEGQPVRFNQAQCKIPGLLASNGTLHQALLDRLKDVPLNADIYAKPAPKS